jgi:rhodanese-related sulfurtransferase
MKNSKRPSRMVGVVILLGLILPPVAYWALYLRAPLVTPQEARRVLSAEPDTALLVDVRPAAEYQKRSLRESVNVPLQRMLDQPDGSWRAQLEGKRQVFLICNSGLQSAQAATALRRLGLQNTYSVRGGLDAWLAAGLLARDEEEVGEAPPGHTGRPSGLSRARFTLLEQAVITGAAFGLKPLYMLMSLLLVVVLWRSAAPDLVAVRQAMAAFFLGEAACAVNFLAFAERSLLLDYLHTYGMLVSFGLTAYALMVLIDDRIVHFSEPGKPCTLLSVCRRCYKYQPVTCSLRQVFLFAIPATAIVALMPLAADLGLPYYVGDVFGSDVFFGHIKLQQVIEVRLAPLVSVAFLAAAFIVLVSKGEEGLDRSRLLFAIALGPLSFAFARFTAFWAYSSNPLWAEAWEEILEFLFIGLIFWIAVRLWPASRAEPTAAPAS